MNKLLEKLAPKWEVETKQEIIQTVTYKVRAWTKKEAEGKAMAARYESVSHNLHMDELVSKEVSNVRREK